MSQGTLRMTNQIIQLLHRGLEIVGEVCIPGARTSASSGLRCPVGGSEAHFILVRIARLLLHPDNRGRPVKQRYSYQATIPELLRVFSQAMGSANILLSPRPGMTREDP